MTCKDCIHDRLCYKENDYENFPDRCGDFISVKVLEDAYTPEQVKELFDEGYKTGYADALLEVEELCQRKKKLFGSDMRTEKKND